MMDHPFQEKELLGMDVLKSSFWFAIIPKTRMIASGNSGRKERTWKCEKMLALVLSAVMVFSLCLCPAAFADTVRYEDAGDVEISGDKVDTISEI